MGEDDKFIGQQITGGFPELIFQNPEEHGFLDKGDMIFWFHEPLGGWRQGTARYYFLEEIPMESFEWPKQPKIYDGTLRKSLKDFAEGDIVEGKCESIHLTHGLLIDFGCTFLGLLPMDEPAWTRLYHSVPHMMYETIRPDFNRFHPSNGLTIFKCKIRRKLDPKFSRWPVELDILKPSWLTDFVIPIRNSFPKILAVAQELSNLDEREYASHHGRPYRTPRCYTYSFADNKENHKWLQMQQDYFPEDHNQQFKKHDLSPLVLVLQQLKDKLSRDYNKGKILADLDDFHIT